MQTVLTDLKQRGMPGVVLQEGRTAISLLKLAIEHDVEAEFAGQVLALFDNAPPSPARPQVQATAADHEQLSPRELEVLTLVAMGLTNPEIANKLVISPGTVKRHTINIYNKLGVHNRTQAVTRARALNLL
jgi:LuxR family maltose regulon positive regulatory protein